MEIVKILGQGEMNYILNLFGVCILEIMILFNSICDCEFVIIDHSNKFFVKKRKSKIKIENLNQDETLRHLSVNNYTRQK